MKRMQHFMGLAITNQAMGITTQVGHDFALCNAPYSQKSKKALLHLT